MYLNVAITLLQTIHIIAIHSINLVDEVRNSTRSIKRFQFYFFHAGGSQLASALFNLTSIQTFALYLKLSILLYVYERIFNLL